MTNNLRETCREVLDSEWRAVDKMPEQVSALLDDMDGKEFLLEATSRKILALPFPEQAVFLLYYGFHMNDSQISEVLVLPYAHGMRIGMLNTLQAWASTPEVFCDPEALSQACKLVLKKLIDEVNMQPDVLHAYSRHFRKQLRKVRAAQKPVDYLLRGVSKAAAVLLAVSIGFSTAMVTNAEFREKVLEWIVETYPKYSKIQLDGVQNRSGSDRASELASFQITYIPDGYELVYQSNLETMKHFRYVNSAEQSIIIQIVPGDGSNNYNTEGAEVKTCIVGNRSVLYWKKDTFSMCIAKDRDWLIVVMTELPFDDTFKILENIKF